MKHGRVARDDGAAGLAGGNAALAHELGRQGHELLADEGLHLLEAAVRAAGDAAEHVGTKGELGVGRAKCAEELACAHVVQARDDGRRSDVEGKPVAASLAVGRPRPKGTAQADRHLRALLERHLATLCDLGLAGKTIRDALRIGDEHHALLAGPSAAARRIDMRTVALERLEHGHALARLDGLGGAALAYLQFHNGPPCVELRPRAAARMRRARRLPFTLTCLAGKHGHSRSQVELLPVGDGTAFALGALAEGELPDGAAAACLRLS